MFDADRPITRSDQDRLNRTTFAKYLARCMLDHQDAESLVIGLEGGWGAGKTSVINLVIEELNFAASNLLDEDKPIILNFSAWSYSGQEQLIYNFFRRLASTLHDAPALKNGDRIIYLLDLYVSFFTNKPAPSPYQKRRSWFGRKQDVYAWESGRDLTAVKAELNQLLLELNRKIIIVIDNISRLYDKEIKQLFQIIKSMGDYNNTVYLLAFDKEQVTYALDKLDINGAELIEKVVQLPFTIPSIQQQDLEIILADHLNSVLAEVPQDTWNNEYWADLYYSGLLYLFKTGRDIARYVNTLHFSYARVRDIVNPMDFFALTAIEVFLPTIYNGIKDNKDLFANLFEHVYELDETEIVEEKLRCDEIIARENTLPRPTLLKLLMLLFPRIRHIYEPNVKFFHSSDLAIKLKRICDPDAFDGYFRLSMQSSHISAAEFNTILSVAENKEALDQSLMRLNQDNRINNFLSQLDGEVLNTLPDEVIYPIIATLLDNGDLFPIGISGPLSLDTPMRIHRIIHGLLQKIKTEDEHFLILQRAIADTHKSLFILIHELREQEREHSIEEDTYLPAEFRDLTTEQLVSLRGLVVTKIQAWAHRDQLASYPFLLQILTAWRDWGNPDECRAYIEKMTETDRGIIAFLTAVLDKPITEAMTIYKKKPEWEGYITLINSFVSANLLEPHAKALFEDQYFEKLREREQLALMIFLDLIKADTTKIIPQTSP